MKWSYKTSSMKFVGYIRKSMGLTLATLMILSSLVIESGLGGWELREELLNQRSEFHQQSKDLMNVAVGGATNAAWSLDKRLAHQVVSGLITKPGVKSIGIRANVRSGFDEVLVHLENKQSTPGSLTAWVARNFFANTEKVTRDLSVSESGNIDKVGVLEIEFATQYQADKYIASVYSILASSIIEALLIGIVLFLVVFWMVTLPLKRVVTGIAQIGPDLHRGDGFSIPVPSVHSSNELGQLFHHINQLLERVATSQIDLRRLATRDPLTGLANRTLIQEQLQTMLANARRSEELVAVIFLDLDRFKAVNDSLGHNIGDSLLKAVAKALLDAVREQDAVGRLGGDEFLLLAPAKAHGDIIALANRVIDALSKPFSIEGYELRTNASLGIAIFPADGQDVDTLMRSADLAMYRAKADEVKRWHLYSDDMSLVLSEELELETALIGAIHRGELELYLQPQFHAQDGKLAACEALLRWKYDDNWIAPFEFIRIAEHTGMILEIGDWVIAEACRFIQRWGERAVRVSVNVSGRQLGDANFVSRVFAITRRYKVDPGLIELEITETMLIENLDHCFERLKELRDAGFGVSIDDFGTGYSSLAYLTRLPIDELKIDRSFVSGSQHSPVILKTIVAMARALDLLVVAEGVETEEQRRSLAESGCDFLQGYLLAKPMPVDEFESNFLWLSEKKRRKA